MVKRTLKRLMALFLSILMVMTMFTDVFPPALAAEGDGGSTPPAADTLNLDFEAEKTGKPRLYVDFLGDNGTYRADRNPADLGNLVAPGDEDQSKLTNGDLVGNTWERYQQTDVKPGTIFWVGVGIDRMNVLDLFSANNGNGGAYSLEVGFYYNNQFIEPYVGTDYKTTITQANVENYTHKWGEQYTVVAAETGLTPQTDGVTGEALQNPSLDQITADSNWKMTYVSLERKPDAVGANRFAGIYDGKFHPVDETDIEKNEETKYVMLIPFRLKEYDTDKALCLRLARNASHLTMGGGDKGDTPYAAWERLTVRNPGHELKLMTTFTGDLNIFTGGKYLEDPYDAALKINDAGGLDNTATMTITGDPSPNPVKANEDGQSITGLRGGTGLTLELTCATGYSVEVTVTSADGIVPLPFTEVKAAEHYTLIMPEQDVLVTVTFTLEDRDDFWAYLSENREKEDPLEKDGAVEGNGAVVQIQYPHKITVDKDTALEDGKDMPRGAATHNKAVTVEVETHKDYYAVVELYNQATRSNMLPSDIQPDGIDPDSVTKEIILPYGGTVTFTMPRSDMVVKVAYLPAVRHKAALEVYHDTGAPVLPANVAQLTGPVYTDKNEALPSYSGVVYHQVSTDGGVTPDNHSALESPFWVLDKVDASTATLSGSLGGDGGKLAAPWSPGASSFMALAYSATAVSGFAGKLTPYDLKQLDVKGAADGLRKNAMGEYYTDSSMAIFYDRLYAVAQLAKTAGTYQVDVKDVGGKDPEKVLYSYYNLTPQQVQMYLLDYEDYLNQVETDGPGAVKPGLREAAAADTALAAYTWWTPVETPPLEGPVPPTIYQKAFLDARAGRDMAVVLEADSAYTVKEVVLADPTGTYADVKITPRAADYQNVYPFTMPDYDCTVQVTYTLRRVKGLSLGITGAAGLASNAITMTAHTPKAGSAATELVTQTTTGTIPNVISGSTVTVKVRKNSGYQVTAAATYVSNGNSLVTTPANTVNMADGTVFTFLMPTEDAAVKVTYSPVSVPKNTATIKSEYYPGSAEDFRNNAVWHGTNQVTLTNVNAGTALTADVNIAPGFYIHSMAVTTATGSFPYTYTGNGYNNGLGGKVSVYLTMPSANVELKIIFREGPPPVEPELPLTLQVSDPENTGSGTPLVFADNRASAAVTREADAVAALGPVGKGTDGKGALADMKYVQAGDLVVVDFAAAAGYHVKSVTVEPSTLGATVEWLSETSVQFIMPAGAAAITVAYGKGEKTTWFMDLAKSESGKPDGTGDPGNFIPRFTSPTIVIMAPDTKVYPVASLPLRVPTDPKGLGAGAAGQTVILDLDVAPGWYLHSLTVRAGGVRLAANLPDGNGYNGGLGGTVKGSFVMPGSDVSVTANFRFGPPPEKPDYQMELLVVDPENVTDGTADWVVADNYASAVLSGGSTGTTAILGQKQGAMQDGTLYARPGDTVTVDYHADPGFALEIIVVTPAGLKVVPTYQSGGKASFTMPASSITAMVRFRKGTPIGYTADLVFRLPAGVTLDKVGGGTFGDDYAVTPKRYAVNAAPGDKLDLSLYAKDGYYIRAIEITPAYLGLDAGLSGAFGYQSGNFVMPSANVTVNVWFEKLWPDQVKYDLNLKVLDADLSGSAANFRSVAGVALAPPDNAPVSGGGTKRLQGAAKDRDTVVVALNPATGYLASPITITDAMGYTIPWTYAPGGIQLTMPPRHTTVSIRFGKGTLPLFDATLHISGLSGDAKLSVPGKPPVTADGAVISDLAPGAALALETKPNTDSIVSSAYAVSSRGEQLVVPVNQVTAGGKAEFGMPDAHAHAWVTFAPDTRVAGDQTATLIVSGPTDSGKAQMTSDTLPDRDTGVVNAGSSGLMFAPKDDMITVTVTPEIGYVVTSVQITDVTGKPVPYSWVSGGYNTDSPPVWTPNPLQQFSYKMPAGGAAVHVTLGGQTAGRTDLTAQVVVNDEAYTDTVVASRNSALLRKVGDIAGSAKLVSLAAGDLVYLDIEVHPGFKVESITVIPTRYGISPGLSLAPTKGQTTSFVMPDDDVVVYVKFAPDDARRYTAILDVEDPSNVPENRAFIHSDYSGRKGPVTGNTGIETVRAAKDTEWVTVDYEWGVGHSVALVTVLDSSLSYVPFTQVDADTITFPMVDDIVTVTVTYQNTVDPPKFDAVLHVIDLDDPAASPGSWGKLTWNGTTTGEIKALGGAGAQAILPVPAGQEVTLDAFAQADTYIKAAYVLYEKGGQMIACDFPPDDPGPGFTGSKTAKFIMHPGVNEGPPDNLGAVHVYVYMTKATPTTTDFTSVLMLQGPAADETSTAKMTRSGGPESAVVKVNGTHGYVTATKGETITVTVLVNPDYTIDNILMTPLGISLPYKRTGNAFTFTMPAQNMAVRVRLKASGEGEYKATLHYSSDGSAPKIENWASIGFTADDESLVETMKNGDYITVPEGTKVDLKAAMNSPYVILAAYVLKGGDLVPLEDSLEGIGEVNSAIDSTVPDAKSVFTMPGADVDVFVYFTDAPPTAPWYTAILTVTDEDGTGGVNSGLNSAEIKTSVSHSAAQTVYSYGVPTHAYLPVAVGEKVTVTVDDAHSGYEFERPATITHSPDAAGPNLLETATAPKHVYTYDTQGHNSAVSVHFKTSAVTKKPLTVVAVDNDNPGNGTVTNTVAAAPAGLAELTLCSTTSAGARQSIPNVNEGVTVNVTVTPAPGYALTARLITGAGAAAIAKPVALAQQPDGTWLGSFAMPSRPATLVVTYYKTWSATLTLIQSGVADQSSQAKMTESSFGGYTSANIISPTGRIDGLPGGTVLATSLFEPAKSIRVMGVLVTQRDATWALPAIPVEGGPDEYRHTMTQANADVTMILAEKTNTTSYLASVATKKAPAGFTPPTITASTATTAKGSIWTVAQVADTVTVQVTVPAGHRADLTATGGAGLSTASLPTSGSATFTMPAANVEVTVTYVKTSFTATLELRDTAMGGGTLTGGGSTVINSGDVIPNLAQGMPLGYTTAPTADHILAGILLTTAGGVSQYLPDPDPTTLTMPADDVTVTMIFGPKPTNPDIPDAEEKLYTVTVTTVGGDDLPGNRAHAAKNLTVSGLSAGTVWASGYGENDVLVTFSTEPGYTAVVTAADAGGNTVAVLQQDAAGDSTAFLTMPYSNVTVTISYYGPGDVPPVLDEHDLTLKLVGHGKEAENKANLQVENGATLSLKGSDAPDENPVSVIEPTAAKLGVNLDLSADWKSDYIIERATITVGAAEVELDLNRYGTNATSLFYMPDADATVTVYYKRVYTATLNISGGGAGDTVSMVTDDRDPVTNHGDKLEKLMGDEEIRTTAVPGTDRRLVGVLYSSAKTGAHTVYPPLPPVNDRYDFTMIEEDVLVTAIFEPNDGGSYIAKVALDPTGDGNGVAGNTVSIKNDTDKTAQSGAFWTLAKPDNLVTVTVTLAAGYQAQVTSAKADSTGDGIYVNRIYITPGSGKTTTFTMPDDDATVTIKFIKGYTATLQITDVSKLVQESTATLAVGTDKTITGISDGADPAGIAYTTNQAGVIATADAISKLENGTPLKVALTPGAGVTATVTKTTRSGGTQYVDTDNPAQNPFAIVQEDVLVSVLLRDASDVNDLLAKVALVGESDINGNAATIMDKTPTLPNGTVAGDIWTSTKAEHTITVDLTVAKGYIAVAKVQRDDDLELLESTGFVSADGTIDLTANTVSFGYKAPTAPGADPNIGASQSFTFTMPGAAPVAETDVTVIIEYIFAGLIPAPHDPDRAAEGKLDQGHIYGVNRGVDAVITIPTLIDESGKLYNADQYDDADPLTSVKFLFYLYDKDNNKYIPLVEDTDITVTPVDPEAAGSDPYNYGNYYTKPAATPDPEVKYTGARFVIAPKGNSDNAKALAAILDNDGSLDATGLPLLYVAAQNGRTETSGYVQVLVRPYFELTGTLLSYGPTHPSELALHALKGGLTDTPNTNPALPPVEQMVESNYEFIPAFTGGIQAEESGTDLWAQTFSIKSSELAVVDGAATYKLIISKPGHITYTRMAITLEATALGEQFVIADEIRLVAGNVMGAGMVKDQERSYLVSYVMNGDLWSQAATDADADWDISAYNPGSAAYWCDLNGDGAITDVDLGILMDTRNFNTTRRSYNWADGTRYGCLPYGLGTATIELADKAMAEEPPTPEPESPATPEMPEILEPPEVPEAPDAPETPETPETPEAPIEPAPPTDPALPPEPEHPPETDSGDPVILPELPPETQIPEEREEPANQDTRST